MKTDYGKILRCISEEVEDFGYVDIYNRQGEKTDLDSTEETIFENLIGYLKDKNVDKITTRSLSDIAYAFYNNQNEAYWELRWKKYDMDTALDRNLTYNRISTKESWYDILSRPKNWQNQENDIQNEQSLEDKKEILGLKEKIEELEQPMCQKDTNKKEIYKNILTSFLEAMEYEVSKFEDKIPQFEKAKKECKMNEGIDGMNEGDLLYALNEFYDYFQVLCPAFFKLSDYVLAANNIPTLSEDDI